MKSAAITLVRYDADDGMVFDYAVPRLYKDAEGNEIQEHLYVRTLFIGVNDSIDNYIEIENFGLTQ